MRLCSNVAFSLVCSALLLIVQACARQPRSPTGQDAGTGAGGAGQAATTGSGGAAASSGSGSRGAGMGGVSGTNESPDAGRDDGGSGKKDGGADFDASTEIDLSGTWISQVKTLATENGPIVGDTDANLTLVFRVVFSNSGNMLNAKYEICDLTSVTTPDVNKLKVTFTPTVVATLTTLISESDPAIGIGDPLPFPDVTIRTGIDVAGDPIDSDTDSNPGVTIPTAVGVVLSADAYAGLTVKASLTSTLTAPDQLDGTGTVSANGIIFGSTSPLLTSGTFSVMPKSQDVPFTAQRLLGDVPCIEVLKKFD